MTRQNPPASAPMPKAEEDIRDNSMKLFAYFMTIAGLADYPSNARMFRQKDLMLTKIKEATKITDKTVKLYLYYLEKNKLIEYRGEYQFDLFETNEVKEIQEKGLKGSEYRKALINHAASVWKKRNKEEKDGVYIIPRPYQYTPVPEITLERLNEDYQVSELELDIYLFLCKYRDECVNRKENYKAMTLEQFRDILNLKYDNDTNRNIRNSLCFLEKVGLIEMEIGYKSNRKNAKIPCFKIKEVWYYIGKPLIEFKDNECMTEQKQKDLEDLNKRVLLGNQRYLDKQKNK